MITLCAALALLPAAQQPIAVHPGPVVPGLHPIAFAAAPSGSKVLVCLEDGSCRILDTKTHETVKELDKHPQPAYAAAWSDDGQYLATGDETARIWVASARSGAKLREFRTHIRGIQKLSFNHDRSILLSTGKDDVISEYNLNKPSNAAARTILGKGANFYGATFHPMNPTVFATGILGIGAREYSTDGHVLGFFTGHDNQGVYDVAFNPSGSRLATAGRDGTAIVWDTKTYKRLATLKGHGDWVMYVAFSPNGKLIATSSTDRTVKVWNATNFQKIADLPGQSFVGSPLCFTADGKTLLTVSDSGGMQYNTITPPQPAAEPAAPATAHKRPVRRTRRHR